MVTTCRYIWNPRIVQYVSDTPTITMPIRKSQDFQEVMMSRYCSKPISTKFISATICGDYAWASRRESAQSNTELRWYHRCPEEFLPYLSIDFIRMPFRVSGVELIFYYIGVRETFCGPEDLAIMWKLSQ